jgi:hypothetical protein
MRCATLGVLQARQEGIDDPAERVTRPPPPVLAVGEDPRRGCSCAWRSAQWCGARQTTGDLRTASTAAGSASRAAWPCGQRRRAISVMHGLLMGEFGPSRQRARRGLRSFGVDTEAAEVARRPLPEAPAPEARFYDRVEPTPRRWSANASWGIVEHLDCLRQRSSSWWRAGRHRQDDAAVAMGRVAGGDERWTPAASWLELSGVARL